MRGACWWLLGVVVIGSSRVGVTPRIVQVDILAKVLSSQELQKNQLKKKHLEALGPAFCTEF